MYILIDVRMAGVLFESPPPGNTEIHILHSFTNQEGQDFKCSQMRTVACLFIYLVNQSFETFCQMIN